MPWDRIDNTALVEQRLPRIARLHHPHPRRGGTPEQTEEEFVTYLTNKYPLLQSTDFVTVLLLLLHKSSSALAY